MPLHRRGMVLRGRERRELSPSQTCAARRARNSVLIDVLQKHNMLTNKLSITLLLA